MGWIVFLISWSGSRQEMYQSKIPASSVLIIQGGGGTKPGGRKRAATMAYIVTEETPHQCPGSRTGPLPLPMTKTAEPAETEPNRDLPALSN